MPGEERLADFRSILFDEADVDPNIDGRQSPEFFGDLNLDQIVASITAGRDEYNLQPFFYVPLKHVESIDYRYDIFRDLENHALFGSLRSFAKEMRAMRRYIAQADKLRHRYQKQSWFMDAADLYCSSVNRLTERLKPLELRSRGFLAYRTYLVGYIESGEFTSLVADTKKLRADLAAVRYFLHIAGNRIKVDRYDQEPDYSADVLQTFQKFGQGEPKEYTFDDPFVPEMNHVEEAILDFVARLYPGVFSSLEEYASRHRDCLDSTIATFDREIQFYIACIEYIGRFRSAGLHFCYPTVSDRSKEIDAREVFDLALANKLLGEKAPVITNDFWLRNPERILVVSGPNQGGKTTFARTFGQLHYLASIGCPVPGCEAKLFLFDKLFTHFEREESVETLSGKLEDDLIRIHRILESASTDSILIMNESFVSTTLSDALFLSKQIMHQIIRMDMLCVSVTFLDELASLGGTTVSMVSTVNPADPALRTFKVVRKPADGLAYAAAIAEKYRLTYENIRIRIAS